MVISKDNVELAKISDVKVDDLDVMIENEIETVDAMTPPEDYIDETGELDDVTAELFEDDLQLEEQALIDASLDVSE